MVKQYNVKDTSSNVLLCSMWPFVGLLEAAVTLSKCSYLSLLLPFMNTMTLICVFFTDPIVA